MAEEEPRMESNTAPEELDPRDLQILSRQRYAIVSKIDTILHGINHLSANMISFSSQANGLDQRFQLAIELITLSLLNTNHELTAFKQELYDLFTREYELNQLALTTRLKAERETSHLLRFIVAAMVINMCVAAGNTLNSIFRRNL